MRRLLRLVTRLGRPWPALALVVLALAACKRDGDTVLVVVVELSAPRPLDPVAQLRVKVEAGTSMFTHHFDGQGGNLPFPADFSLQLPSDMDARLRLEVIALGAGEKPLAQAVMEIVDLRRGERNMTRLFLACLTSCQAGLDGGVDAPMDAAGDLGPGRDAIPSCGNARIDPGELCDTGIPAGWPGACPPANCDDGVGCTLDRVIGSGCDMTCEHTVIVRFAAGDACCPANATAATDPDCSPTCGNGKLEAGETCDTLSATPLCPNESMGCDDRNPCTRDLLVSRGTCAAVCVHHPIRGATSGDGCCPVGVTATQDSDCPAVCGNWQKDPDEACDRALPSSNANGCPSSCEAATEGCKVRTLAGAGCGQRCVETTITRAVAGDRCCPSEGGKLAGRNLDLDCPILCDNGVLEAGEACDKRIPAGQPGACPTVCPATGNACLPSRLEGKADDCSARCRVEPITACSTSPDGCCPQGCVTAQDPDCSASCGNGVVDPGESCDTAIAQGTAGACPAACADTLACTLDRLVSAGTCHARCAYTLITQNVTGDGCCPEGGHHLLDGDCAATCGNKVVESPQETCDKGLPEGTLGACPQSCPALPAGCSRLALRGASDTCSSQCTLETVTACASDDGCCPPGCTRASDSDCPAVCGNSVVEPGESCDVGITAGKTGSCPALCDDGDACTENVTLGRRIDCTRSCRFDRITLCRGGDRCCPAGCTREVDADCAPPSCGNRKVEAGETCDPPGSCPTRCPDDGDPCTVESPIGDAKLCQARCVSEPRLTCSGGTADRCCPSGCVARTDVDCATPPEEPPLL